MPVLAQEFHTADFKNCCNVYTWRKRMKLTSLIVIILTLTGCISTYRDFPVDAIGKIQAPGTCEVMYYNVKKFDILDSGGYSKLQEFFQSAPICRKMKQVNEVPGKGLYLEIEEQWKPLSMPALIFGYISLSTMTILPCWSTKDGYIVYYHLYQDGQKKETYRYDITRKGGIWLGLLPFAWVNAITYSEGDAFAATANQFWADAHPYFLGETSPTAGSVSGLK